MMGSQQSRVELMNELTGLTREIFVGEVVNNVRRSSPTSACFQDMEPGQYRLEGKKMVGNVDLEFKTGGMASDGRIPDYVGLDSTPFEVVPTRRYVRLALDNFIEKRASGPGAFEDLGDRIFDKLWDAWESMEIRHSIGSSSGLVCTVLSRSANDTFRVQNGYGHTGTNPIQHLSPNSIIGWYDVGAAGVGGASEIDSIDPDTNEIVVKSSAQWEPSAQIAPGDLIYFATTSDITSTRFTLERDLAPNGLGDIVNPSGSLTTAFGIAEATNRRWKPFRHQSVVMDHLEITEHYLALGSKRGFAVSAETDKSITFPSVVAQIARSLMAFQQQAYTGSQLKGGYSLGGGEGHEYTPHAGVMVAGVPIYADTFFYQDVFMTLCLDKLFRIPLGEQADFWEGDGSMWQRISDYDGKDSFVVDYLNNVTNYRGAHSAITGIVTDLDDSLFTSVPSY